MPRAPATLKPQAIKNHTMDKRYFFMQWLIERLGQPDFFNRLVAVILRVTAALVVLLSLTIVFKVGKLTFELTPNRVLGGILFEAFFIVAVYGAVHALLIRARDVELQNHVEHYALATLVLLFKLMGEAYCVFVSLMAIGGGVFVWFTNQDLSKVLGPLVRVLFPGIGDEPSFMSGVEFMASGVLIGFAMLVVTYGAAQALAILIRPPQQNAAQAPVSEFGQSYRSRFGS